MLLHCTGTGSPTGKNLSVASQMFLFVGLFVCLFDDFPQGHLVELPQGNINAKIVTTYSLNYCRSNPGLDTVVLEQGT